MRGISFCPIQGARKQGARNEIFAGSGSVSYSWCGLRFLVPMSVPLASARSSKVPQAVTFDSWSGRAPRLTSATLRGIRLIDVSYARPKLIAHSRLSV